MDLDGLTQFLKAEKFTERQRQRSGILEPGLALRSSHHGLFLIKGHPASGKFRLMERILEHPRGHLSGQTMIWVFNARDGLLKHSTEGCYRSLLHQLIKKSPKLRKASFRNPILPTSSERWEIPMIREKFCEAVFKLQQKWLVLMIDERPVKV